jgi:hypothetical protein
VIADLDIEYAWAASASSLVLDKQPELLKFIIH